MVVDCLASLFLQTDVVEEVNHLLEVVVAIHVEAVTATWNDGN